MKLDYDLLAKEYARHRQVHPDVLKKLLSTGQITQASKVLEIGCGTGNYSHAIYAAANCMCWGIDPSEKMLAAAQERGDDIIYQKSRAERLDFPPDFFDLVFSVDVIHHVSNRAAACQHAHHVLRPGGRTCTVTDSEDIIRRREPHSVYFPETIPVELKRYPPISDLTAMMKAAGFQDIHEELVEFPYMLTSSEAFRRKTYSSLHLISEEAFQRGLERMEADLANGPIQCAARYVLVWGTK
jgi:ubiquinone/menaquinone biosynthesis C-methylase UbiE